MRFIIIDNRQFLPRDHRLTTVLGVIMISQMKRYSKADYYLTVLCQIVDPEGNSSFGPNNFMDSFWHDYRWREHVYKRIVFAGHEVPFSSCIQQSF